MAVSVESVRDAILARKEYILANEEALTVKRLLRMLEQELGLQEKALKNYMHVAGATVDMIFAEQSPGVAAGSAGGQEDEDGKQPAPKRARAGAKKGTSAAKAVLGRPIEVHLARRLLQICRLACIEVGPEVLSMVSDANADEQGSFAVELLRGSLAQEGLSQDSAPEEIMAVRARLAPSGGGGAHASGWGGGEAVGVAGAGGKTRVEVDEGAMEQMRADLEDSDVE